MDQQFIDLISYLVSYPVNYSVILLSNYVICYAPLSYPVICYAALNMFNRIPMYASSIVEPGRSMKLKRKASAKCTPADGASPYASSVGYVQCREDVGCSQWTTFTELSARNTA